MMVVILEKTISMFINTKTNALSKRNSDKPDFEVIFDGLAFMVFWRFFGGRQNKRRGFLNGNCCRLNSFSM